jgi:hypothetical protein
MANELCNLQRPTYELVRGRLIDNIPKVLADGRLPIWVARFHEGRTGLASQFPEWNSWSYTPGELAVYPAKSGDVLHVIGCSKDELTEAGKLIYPKFQPKAVIVDHGIDASDIYQQLEAMTPAQGVIRVSPADIQKYAGKDLSRRDVSGNKLQRLLFRHSSEVPKQFAESREIMKNAIETSFAPEYQTAMGSYFIAPNPNVPKLMAWGVDWLDVGSQSCAFCDVYGGSGRLVSVAPEALVARGKSVGRVVIPARKELTVEQFLEEEVQTSAFAPDQIAKLQNVLDKKGYAITQR